MSFPATVSQIASARKRVKKVSRPRPRSPDGVQDDQPPGVGVGGPILDIGRDASARLVKEAGRWKWDWLLRPDQRARIEVKDDAVLLFPGMKEAEPSPAELTAAELLSASDKYLQTILDDSSDSEPYNHLAIRDVLSDSLIADLLAERGSKQRVDVYDGDKVVAIQNPKARAARTVLGFVTGLVGDQLNLSPILPAPASFSRSSGMRFVPLAEASLDFATPILQVCASSAVSPSRLDRDASSLVVRIQASTHLFHVYPAANYVSHASLPAVSVEQVAVISTLANLEERTSRHVDVALHPLEFGKVLIVDELGAVYLWTEKKVEKAERQTTHVDVRKIRESVTVQRDSFFRIAWGTRPGTALVMSRTQLILLDLEADGPPEIILELKGDRRMFTSLDKTALERGATHTVVCTTYEVIWVDECVSGTPVLSWTHDYGAGRLKDLEVKAISHEAQDAVLLSSKSEKMIMVFHVPAHPPISATSAPYILEAPPSVMPLSSLLCLKIQRGLQERRAGVVLLGQASNGDLWSLPLSDANGEDERNGPRLRVKWSEAVEALASGTRNTPRRDLGGGMEPDVAVTAYQECDLQDVWREINAQPTDEVENFEVAEFQAYLRELDAPFEHLMTAGDLARDLIHGQTDHTRSNLLRPLHTQSDLSADFDKVNVARHMPVVTHHALDIENLESAFPAPRVPGRPEVAQRHKSDVQRLALDLTLSRTVINSDEIVQPYNDSQQSQATEVDSPEDLFAQATGALSLNEREPSRIRFSYLDSRTSSLLDTPADSAEPLQSLPARALLEEWTIGADPAEYQWKPWTGEALAPRADDSPHRRPTQFQRPIKPLPGLGTRSPVKLKPTVSQPLPPTLRPAASVPVIMTLPPAIARSSPPPEFSRDTGGSQDTGGLRKSGSMASLGDVGFAQTQVEPGRFGGRTGGTGKKKVKKRAGGF